MVKCLASLLLLGLLLPAPLYAADALTAGSTRIFTNAALGLTVVAAEVDLPPGRWEVKAVAPGRALEQVYLVPQSSPEAEPAGRRVQSGELERRLESGRWRLQGLYAACVNYAAAHGGQGPSVLSDLDPKRYASTIQSLERSPWPEDTGKNLKGPFYFLIPDVPIQAGPGRRAPNAAATPLALELRPFADDGKHWVLMSDGRTERRVIDRELLAKHNLSITFVRTPGTAGPLSSAGGVRHAVLGLRRDANAAAVMLTLTDRVRGARTEVRWSLAGAQPGPPELLGQWAQARAGEWQPLLEQGDSPILRAWAARMPELYGARLQQRATREAARTTDAFSILGGQAALRETLQLELLRSPRTATREEATVPVATIKGVEVKSHPFAEMLAGREGGRLPLADHVPADRFFVYFAKPSAVFPFLDKGGDFLFRAGSLFTTSAVDDNLKSRYLRRLGVGERLARQVLESGEVTELALVMPDLFFLDGTDITVLMRLRNPSAIVAAMRIFGVVDLKADTVTERALDGGRSAFWARQGDLLVVSTRRTELDDIVALGARQGAGSLGRSAEFRYMLTQLPLKKDTRALVYLSDPFIRRMVGPAVKIGQLRRMRARAEMEITTAGALLFLLDGRREKPQLDRLIQLGYVPATVAAGGYGLRDDLSAVSPLWGSSAETAALGAVPVEKVTASEAQAYRNYVDEYSRYWRQYFDPVIMRLDDAAEGALELSTFILPLLDSDLYNMVRGFLAVREGGAPLRVPAVAPDPVLLLSLNLTDDAWVKISGSWSQLFSRYTGIDPEIFDRFGPGLHVAVQDADPVIVLGNADILGGLGGQLLSGNLRPDGLSLLLTLLTRPCKILVELQDERAVLDILRQIPSGRSETRGEIGAEFRQVTGRDAWIYTLNVPGFVKIRFGIEVRNGYLVISNIPWSQPVGVTRVEGRELNGAELSIVPGAVRLGLPALFATQSEQSQLAAVKGMAALYPLLVTVSATPEEAAARHAALFGSKPLHPGPGNWVWKDKNLESSVYGNATGRKQPAYRPDMGDFGLFEGVVRLSVNMQFEAGGLRAVCRWIWKGK